MSGTRLRMGEELEVAPSGRAVFSLRLERLKGWAFPDRIEVEPEGAALGLRCLELVVRDGALVMEVENACAEPLRVSAWAVWGSGFVPEAPPSTPRQGE